MAVATAAVFMALRSAVGAGVAPMLQAAKLLGCAAGIFEQAYGYLHGLWSKSWAGSMACFEPYFQFHYTARQYASILPCSVQGNFCFTGLEWWSLWVYL